MWLNRWHIKQHVKKSIIMKNILFLTLFSITALAAQAAESIAPGTNETNPEVKSFDNSDIYKCLNALDERIQSQFENELVLISQLSIPLYPLNNAIEKTEAEPGLVQYALFAVNTSSE
jgi:hypothetical protein